jgi:hypothetical protein
MNFSQLSASTALIATAAITLISTSLPSQAQVEFLQPEVNPILIESKDVVRWEPLARVKPEKPVAVVLHNTTREPLEYIITTHTNFRTLAPGQKVILRDFALPTFVNINATRSIGVKYGLKVKGNKVLVDLRLTPGQGDTTLNIDDKGAIYLY